MRLLVLAIGKPRDAALAAASREYETRATRYWPPPPAGWGVLTVTADAQWR